MKLDHLTTFLAAAENLNFTQAGRGLHLTQSAVSQQIRELERDLGVSLFERRGRGILLTPAGEALRAKSKHLLDEVRHVRDALAPFGGRDQGVLRIGASNTPGVYLLPFAIGAYARRFPGVRLSLRVTDSPTLMRLMHAGDLDVALLTDLPTGTRLPGWERLSFMIDELALFAPVDHPWSQQASIAVDALRNQPFIFRQADSPTRQLVLEAISRAGQEPDDLVTQFEMGNTEAIKRAVMAGLGVGWISRYTCYREQAAGWLAEIHVEGLRISRPLWLLSHASARPPLHHRQFLDLLCEGSWFPTQIPQPATGWRPAQAEWSPVC